MFEEYERKRKKQVAQMRSIMDYGMGLLILAVGLFFLFRGQLGNFPLNDQLGQPDTLEKIFGSLCLVYGAWRIYRGYKKNYFR